MAQGLAGRVVVALCCLVLVCTVILQRHSDYSVLLSHAEESRDLKAETGLSQFWSNLDASTKRTEEKVRHFQDERYAKGEGTRYLSNEAKTYFSKENDEGSHYVHAHDVRAVSKEDVLGLAGDQARSEEDAFFDDMPKKDVSKAAWVKENVLKKEKLARLRSHVQREARMERDGVDSFWDKRTAYDKARAEAHSVTALSKLHDMMLQKVEKPAKDLDHVMSAHITASRLPPAEAAALSSPTRYAVASHKQSHEPAWPPAGWQPPHEIVQHNDEPASAHAADKKPSDATGGNNNNNNIVEKAIDSVLRVVEAAPQEAASDIESVANSIKDKAAHMRQVERSAKQRAAKERAERMSPEAIKKREHMVRVAASGHMGRGLGGLVSEIFGGDDATSRARRDGGTPISDVEVVYSAIGKPHLTSKEAKFVARERSGTPKLHAEERPHSHAKPASGLDVVKQAAKGTARLSDVVNNLLEGKPLKHSEPSHDELVRAARELRHPGGDGFVIGDQGSVFADKEAVPRRPVHIDVLHPTKQVIHVDKANAQALAELPVGGVEGGMTGAVRVSGSEEREKVAQFFDEKATEDKLAHEMAKQNELAPSEYDMTEKQREAKADRSDHNDRHRDDAFFDKIAAADKQKAIKGRMEEDEVREASYIKSKLHKARTAHIAHRMTGAARAAKEWGFAERSVAGDATPKKPHALAVKKHVQSLVVKHDGVQKGSERGVWGMVLDPWHMFS